MEKTYEQIHQIFNPFLPSWEYVPDGEPHIYGDRVYLFGSHDRFNGTQFCMNDYVCWSAPTADLTDWDCHGIIYRKEQDPHADENSIMQAPDVVKGSDGRFYLYYALGLKPFVSVAVSENPAGPYEYLGMVHYADGTSLGLKEQDIFAFDPGLFMDEDGRCYLYVGFGPDEEGIFAAACRKYHMDGAYVMELSEDMLTVRTEPERIIPKAGIAKETDFVGHEFFEASSMRKINGKYYFIYSSVLSHELCYAVSDYPDRDFQFGGTIVSIGDIGFQGNLSPKNYLGNTHGSLVEIQGQWYIFYHRQTNRNNFSRQACAEPVTILPDGSIPQVGITSQGMNGKPLHGAGIYPAYIACHLQAKGGACTYGTASTPEAVGHPYFTQTGGDREKNGDQYIADMQDGARAGFQYFCFDGLEEIGVELSGGGEGCMEVWTDLSQPPVCTIPVHAGADKTWFYGESLDLQGTYPLYFVYSGTGRVHFHRMHLKKGQL